MSVEKIIKPIEILMVEDNPGDVRLAKEAFKETKIYNNLTIVGFGVESLSLMNKEGKYTS